MHFLTPRPAGRPIRVVPRPRPHNPCRVSHGNGLASSAFARHYSRNHGCFLFLWVLRCFTSPRSLHTPYVFRRGSHHMTGAGFPHSDTLGSTLGWQLPEAYRSLPRPSSAPGAQASTVCPQHLGHTKPTPTRDRRLPKEPATGDKPVTRTGPAPSGPNSVPTTPVLSPAPFLTTLPKEHGRTRGRQEAGGRTGQRSTLEHHPEHSARHPEMGTGSRSGRGSAPT